MHTYIYVCIHIYVYIYIYIYLIAPRIPPGHFSCQVICIENLVAGCLVVGWLVVGWQVAPAGATFGLLHLPEIENHFVSGNGLGGMPWFFTFLIRDRWRRHVTGHVLGSLGRSQGVRGEGPEGTDNTEARSVWEGAWGALGVMFGVWGGPWVRPREWKCWYFVGFESVFASKVFSIFFGWFLDRICFSKIWRTM